MTPFADIPLNSWCWLVGAAALIVLGTKSVLGYHKTRVQLTKYMAWFSWVFLPCLLAFSVPALFTLDHDVIRTTSLIGEFFFFAGLTAQAAILWCLILRRYCSLYAVIIPVGVISLTCWLYDLTRSRVVLDPNFINYYDPRVVSFVIAGLMITLFVPVGVYFLRATSFQVGLKATVTSFMMGLMYVGIGLSAASQEIFAQQLLTPMAAIVNLLIGFLLLGALVAPWRLSVKLPSQTQTSAPPKPTG